MLPLQIDADIRTASTPPGAFYCSEAVHAAVRERIFARSWQFAADADVVRVPNQVYPFVLLEGLLDEPLLLTRDSTDRLACVSNVCTHRGNLVCENAGTQRTLRCRYHGRRFALDGRFEHMPEFAGTADFPSAADDLARVEHALLERWLFVSLGPHAPFDELLAPVLARVGWMPLREMRFDAARSREYLVRCNWALYCENYLEGFHIPFVHSSLNEAINYGAYFTELHRWGSVQVGVAADGEACFELPESSPEHGQRIAAYYFWLFPNTMLNFYPWGLSINVVRPLAVDRTRVSFLSFVHDPSRLDQGAGAELDRVEREDEAIVEAVQKGLRSRLYTRGRYSPTREQGTHHFHRLLAEFLGDGGRPGG